MKLTFIQAHQKVGPLRKRIGYGAELDRNYPNARRVTSSEVELPDKEALKAYRDELCKSALQGKALLKGSLTEPLVNASRKGKADKTEKTRTLILDVDGMSCDKFKAGPKTQEDVIEAAEQVLKLLPDELSQVSYMAMASSSFGTKDKEFGLHIHMLLTDAVDPKFLKLWLRSLNFTRQGIYEKLDLQPTKMAVKSIVDECLAEPTRIVYIAPPDFGPKVKNPFSNEENRFVVVDKKFEYLNLDPLLSELDRQINVVRRQEREKLKELQELYGIESRRYKKENMTVAGVTHPVITDPENMMFTMAGYDNNFVRYNLPGGKSGAYWVRRDNPEIMYCFKPSEEPFLFSKADPEAYERHIEQFGEGYEERAQDDGEVLKLQTRLVIDNETGKYTVLEHDIESDEIVTALHKTAETGTHYLRSRGVAVPDPVPDLYVRANPTMQGAYYIEDGKQCANTFRPTAFLKLPAVEELKPVRQYGMGWLLYQDCPHLAEIILHSLGDDFDCFEHFINWLAYIFQTRDKAKTAWMLWGTQGTGKGLLFSKILQPLFGREYTQSVMLHKITGDMFDDWLNGQLILFIDEFNMNNGTKAEAVKTANMLKNMITEPETLIRGMQVSNRKVRQFLNMIFATNDHDALGMDDKRRLNICPRQERMIRARWNPNPTGEDEIFSSGLVDADEQTDLFDEIVEAELPAMAVFLASFEVSRSNVIKVLQNDAKREAIESGMTSVETFFANLSRGNYAAFAEILDMPIEGLEPAKLSRLRAAKAVLSNIAPHVNLGKPVFVRVEDLRIIYSQLRGVDESANAMSRKLKAHGVATKKSRNPVGNSRLASPASCVSIEWKHACQETMDRIKEYHLAVNQENVAQFPNKEQGQPSNDEQEQRGRW